MRGSATLYGLNTVALVLVLDISTCLDTLIDVDMKEMRLMEATLEPVACCAPLAAPTLSEDEAVATAAVFRALADPARVKIVNLIAGAGEAVCACEFPEVLGLSQPTASHHLKKLVDSGLIDREQRGKWAFFALNRDAVAQLALVADLNGACC